LTLSATAGGALAKLRGIDRTEWGSLLAVNFGIDPGFVTRK